MATDGKNSELTTIGNDFRAVAELGSERCDVISEEFELRAKSFGGLGNNEAAVLDETTSKVCDT